MAKKNKRKVNTLRLGLVIICLILVIVLIISLVVLGIKKVSKKDESVTTEKTEEVVEKEELSEELQARVTAYMELNPDISEEEAKKRVKMNLDYEPYTNVVINSDLDNILILVNKYNGLPEDYEPSDMVTVTSSGENGDVYMRQEAAQAFENLIAAGSQIGLTISACSAFRSYDYQYNLYYNGVANYGEEYADAYWTRPGFSEHQTGLSVDVRLDGDCSDLDAARYSTNYSWFLEHLHDYGFILRYPDDKEEYTLISPESWHIRYVGVDVATYCYENNLCFDEYCAL